MTENNKILNDLTIVLVSFYSNEKIDELISKINFNIKIIIVENSLNTKYKKLIEDKHKNITVIIPNKNFITSILSSSIFSLSSSLFMLLCIFQSISLSISVASTIIARICSLFHLIFWVLSFPQKTVAPDPSGRPGNGREYAQCLVHPLLLPSHRRNTKTVLIRTLP